MTERAAPNEWQSACARLSETKHKMDLAEAALDNANASRSALSVRKRMTMDETPNIRQERIERLLRELKYEVTRGMLEKEIGEEMGFRFYVPISSKIKDGVVFCEFRTRPVQRYNMHPDDLQPRLKVIR